MLFSSRAIISPNFISFGESVTTRYRVLMRSRRKVEHTNNTFTKMGITSSYGVQIRWFNLQNALLIESYHSTNFQIIWSKLEDSVPSPNGKSSTTPTRVVRLREHFLGDVSPCFREDIFLPTPINMRVGAHFWGSLTSCPPLLTWSFNSPKHTEWTKAYRVVPKHTEWTKAYRVDQSIPSGTKAYRVDQSIPSGKNCTCIQQAKINKKDKWT